MKAYSNLIWQWLKLLENFKIIFKQNTSHLIYLWFFLQENSKIQQKDIVLSILRNYNWIGKYQKVQSGLYQSSYMV